MPNIALLNSCNLQCPYCFANTFIEEKKQFITIEQLQKILNFIKDSKPERIGLIGGEPTLHPQFKELLKIIISFCYQNDFPKPIIFTNGIELYKYTKFLSQVGCLININEPEILGNKNWTKLNQSLSQISQIDNIQQNSTIGINLYPNIKNLNYIFDIAKQYNYQQIRASCVAPACSFANLKKDEYYNLMKPIFLNFVNLAKKNNITINLDCNIIPICYFTDAEKELILNQCTDFHSWCEPVIDITPDFRATSCFGVYNPINLENFQNLQEVSRYMLLHEMYEKTLKNDMEKCKTCKSFLNLSCQGGCLGFTK